jgi:hypothetical protein
MSISHNYSVFNRNLNQRTFKYFESIDKVPKVTIKLKSTYKKTKPLPFTSFNNKIFSYKKKQYQWRKCIHIYMTILKRKNSFLNFCLLLCSVFIRNLKKKTFRYFESIDKVPVRSFVFSSKVPNKVPFQIVGITSTLILLAALNIKNTVSNSYRLKIDDDVC